MYLPGNTHTYTRVYVYTSRFTRAQTKCRHCEICNHHTYTRGPGTHTHIHTLIHFYTKFVYIKDHKRVCKQIHTDGCSYDVCTIVQIHIKSKCACLLGGELVWGLVSVSFTRVFYTNNFNQIVIFTHLCSPSVVMSSHVSVCEREGGRDGVCLYLLCLWSSIRNLHIYPHKHTQHLLLRLVRARWWFEVREAGVGQKEYQIVQTTRFGLL